MNIKEKAKEFAILAHKGQVRKSDKEKPMIIHPINVGLILEEYEFDDNVVASGYLHDVIEDTKYSEEEVGEKIVGEWYVRKDEALEKGVCDELVSDISTIL